MSTKCPGHETSGENSSSWWPKSSLWPSCSWTKIWQYGNRKVSWKSCPRFIIPRAEPGLLEIPGSRIVRIALECHAFHWFAGNILHCSVIPVGQKHPELHFFIPFFTSHTKCHNSETIKIKIWACHFLVKISSRANLVSKPVQKSSTSNPSNLHTCYSPSKTK